MKEHPTDCHQRLRQVIIANSEAITFEEAREEWDVVAFVNLANIDGKKVETCICGHTPITRCYTIRDVINGRKLYPVGRVCIKQFMRPELEEKAKTLADLTRIRSFSNKVGPGRMLAIRRDEPGWCKEGRITRRAMAALLNAGALAGTYYDGPAKFNDRDVYEAFLGSIRKNPKQHDLLLAHAGIECAARAWLWDWNGTL